MHKLPPQVKSLVHDEKAVHQVYDFPFFVEG